MCFNGKRLLVLGGADIHTKVVECANEMGIYTIVTDYYSNSPAKMIASQALDYSATDVDSIVRWCQSHSVDGVLSVGIDPLQIAYQQICERLNLPCYGTKEQFRIMTNKAEFKKFCNLHQVNVVPDYMVEDVYCNTVSYPIMIKPTDSRGSRGQTICYTKPQAMDAISFAKQESADNRIICEKYMEGYQDISNAFFVVDSEPYLVKFGDRFLGKKEDNLDRQAMCTRLPSVYSEEFARNSMEKVKNMIRSLGIKYGPVFLQGFLDMEGNVFYYDPGLRMPGSDYERILKRATGFDIVKSLIAFSLTGDNKICYGNPQHCYLLGGGKACILDISARAGLIQKIDYPMNLKNDSHIVYYSQRLHEEDVIPNSGDIRQRVAEFSIFISREEKASISETIESIYHNYHVLDTNQNDMIISRVSNNI